MVVHLPSTMNLYKTFSAHRTRTVVVKPVGPLFKRTERVHCRKKKLGVAKRDGTGSKVLRAYLIKGPGDDNLVGVIWPGKVRNINRGAGGGGGGRRG